MQTKINAPRKTRSALLGYGVFETPEGHLIVLNYDAKGRESNWTLCLATDEESTHAERTLNFRIKRDALDFLDALPA